MGEEVERRDEAVDFIKRLVGAWDCCGTCAGGVLAAHDAEVAARALREAADAWTQGQWSDVMLPKPTSPAVPVIAYANRVGDWLRARAGAAGDGEEA